MKQTDLLMKKVVFFLIIQLSSGVLFGQGEGPYLNKFFIQPVHPQVNDSVKLNLTFSTANISYPGELTFEKYGDSIKMKACVFITMLRVVDEHDMQVNLGTFSKGSYTIHLRLYRTIESLAEFDTCVDPIDTSLHFSVGVYAPVKPSAITEDINIWPNNPSPFDSIYAALSSKTVAWSVDLGYTFKRSNDSFYITHCVVNQAKPEPRNYRDTFYLGRLKSGTYTLHFINYMSWDSTTCSYSNPTDSSISFEVGKSTSLTQTMDENIKVYPNPASQKLYTNSAKTLSVYVYDLQGCKQLEIKTFDVNNPIDIRDLEKGVYLLYYPELNQEQRILIQ